MADASRSADVDKITTQDILLVGHNPLLSQVWNDLLDGDGQHRFGLSTSHLVSIDADMPASACGSLVYTISP
jgi:phosphohistidine phosphatase SixA